MYSDVPVSRVSSERTGDGPGRHRLSSDYCDAIRSVSSRALQYESQIKELNIKLSENLSNFRAIDSLLQEALTGLRGNTERAERALNQHVPLIHDDLDDSLHTLQELARRLPSIQSQVADIRLVYDSGRRKAQALVKDLEWLDTDWYERWRIIIFTSSSPVSWRWKAIMRTIFALCFITFAIAAWIAISGAYRAHRQRLLWGERLMS